MRGRRATEPRRARSSLGVLAAADQPVPPVAPPRRRARRLTDRQQAARAEAPAGGAHGRRPILLVALALARVLAALALALALTLALALALALIRLVLPQMLTVDMTVREVLRLLLDSSDRHIPLVESRALPLLLGSVTRAP